MQGSVLIGEVVGGRYRVERVIGQGGMGTIYEVCHQVLGRKFAMKTLSGQHAKDPIASARFFREANVVARLRHPNVVDVFGWEQLSDGSPCIVMEYLEGEDLAARLRQSGPMPWSAIARIGDEVLSALSATHDIGIVHRDLKPANIFLANDHSGHERAKLLDFGLSKMREGMARVTDPGVVGTPAYMAPEQAQGKQEEVGPLSDVWAMGAILYEMATGDVAYPGSPMQTLYRICHGKAEPVGARRPDVPAAFQEVIDRALSREPARMFTCARSMRAELAASLADVITRQIVAPAAQSSSTPPAQTGVVVAPTGTVTFLFTEIVDGTNRWEQEPAAMEDAVARHDSILCEAMDFHGGYIFKSSGEGFSVAFANASQAAQAAIAAQRMLERAPFSTKQPLEVRMALHTGPATCRRAEYIGPTLSRLARILALGRGSQIIVSGATREQLEQDPIAETELIDVGVHRLRDLVRPEHLYLLRHSDLTRQSPSLSSISRVRHNLPDELSPFVGRERELADIRESVRRHRLVTIAGLGGCGKTRLALQAAAESLGEFPDGVWFVELAALTSPTLIPQTIGNVLGAAGEGMMASPDPWEQRVAAQLKNQTVLLVLDNCEHVIAECAEYTRSLLRHCPSLHILVTSREPLAIEGEVSHRVAPLSLPARRLVEDAMRVDSVRLFVERARVQQPDFALTDKNLEAVCQICEQLEGIPLAIELAAARINLLSAERLADRLRDRLALQSMNRLAAPRQKSLRGTLDWSYELLSPEEQTLLARLSVFRGSFSLAAVEAICSGGPVQESAILALLSQLDQKSLLTPVEQVGEPRYILLDVLRDYAAEKLANSGERRALYARHRDYCVEVAERAAPALKGPLQSHYLDLLDAESDNIRAATLWAVEEDGGQGTLRLAAALHWFWMIRGHVSEGANYIEQAIAADLGASDEIRARALAGCGVLVVLLDPRRAKEMFAESARLDGGRTGTTALAYWGLAYTALMEGESGAVEGWLEKSHANYEAAHDLWGQGLAAALLGVMVGCVPDGRARGEAYCQEAVRAFESCGDDFASALALMNAGEVPRAHGDHSEALAYYERALSICREVGDRSLTAIGLCNSAIALSSVGLDMQAELRLRESLMLGEKIGLMPRIGPVCLLGLAGIALQRRQLERAAELLAASQCAQLRAGGPFHPPDQLYYEDTLRMLQKELESESLESALRRGESIDFSAVVAEEINRLGSQRSQQPSIG